MAQAKSTGTAGIDLERIGPSVPYTSRTSDLFRRWGESALVVVILVGGWLLANRMPAVDLDDGGSLSLAEVSDTLGLLGEGWVFTLAWFAGVMTLVAAIVFPPSERFARAFAVTAGAITTMICPYFVATRLDRIDEQASSLGSGLIVAWIACGIAALVPWVALLWRDRSKPAFGRDWSKWLFIFPAIIWILLLTVFPLIFAITTSRFTFRSGRISREVGWDNYRRLFIEEPIWSHIGRAVLYAAITGAIVMIAGLAWALITNRAVGRADVRRAASFLSITMVPVAVIYLCNKILRDPLNEQMIITFIFVAMAVVTETRPWLFDRVVSESRDPGSRPVARDHHAADLRHPDRDGVPRPRHLLRDRRPGELRARELRRFAAVVVESDLGPDRDGHRRRLAMDAVRLHHRPRRFAESAPGHRSKPRRSTAPGGGQSCATSRCR